MTDDSLSAPSERLQALAATPSATAVAPPLVALVTVPGERARAFTILFLAMMCLGAGQSVMFAVLPSLARELGLSEFEASMPFVVSATIWVFSSGFWGARSDRVGRKPMIVMGLTAFGISFASFAASAQAGVAHLLPLAIAYPAMIATRALYGILGSGASPGAQAYVADWTTREERTKGVATIGAAFGLGTTIGPGIGSVLVIFGLFAPYYFTAFMAFISAAAVFIFLPEPPTRAAPKLPVIRPRWNDPRLMPFIILGLGLSTAAAIPVQTVGYLFIDVLHLSPKAAPQYVGIGLMASSMSALFAQLVIVQRFSLPARALIRWGCAIAMISSAGFAAGHQFGPLVFALALSGLGFGMARPGYTAAASLAVAPEEQGAIAGLVSATAGAGFITGPVIGTTLYAWHHSAPYIFAALLMAVMFVYAHLSPRLRDAGAPPSYRERGDEDLETAMTDG